MVESVAFTCVGALGIKTDGYSVPYLASWAEQSDLSVLEQTAALIDRLASRIEDAVLRRPPGSPRTTHRRCCRTDASSGRGAGQPPERVPRPAPAAKPMTAPPACGRRYDERPDHRLDRPHRARLGWGMPTPHHQEASMTSTPKLVDRPTRRQLAYLRSLATRTGQTFAYPHTRRKPAVRSNDSNRRRRARRRALDRAQGDR